MKSPALAACAAALALSTQALAADAFKWGIVAMGGGGFVSAIIPSRTEKNVIYARTDVGGAYRWNESAKSWHPITDWVGADNMGLLGVDAIALDPSKPGRLYMLAGTEYWNNGKTMILRSEDYGATFDTINVTSRFKTHGNGYGRQNGERLAVDPNNPDILFCGTRNHGLWKSANRGSTWSKVEGLAAPANGVGICFVMFDGTKTAGGSTRRLYAGISATGSNLHVSDDGGATWSPIALPALSKAVMPHRAALTPGGRFLYVTAGNGAGPGFGNNHTVSRGAFLKYDTEAKTWADISPENWIDDPPNPDLPGQTIWDAHFGGYGGVTLNPADSNHIVVSSMNTWKPQLWNNPAKAGWGDRIFSSTDAGATWKNVFGDIADSEIGTVGGDAPVAVLDKNGYNWIEGESIHWAGSIEFDPFNPKRVFVTSGNGIYMADDFSPGKRFQWRFSVRGLEETVPMDLVSIPGGPLITVILDYDGFVHSDITTPVSGSRHFPQMGSTTSIDFARQNPGVVVRVGGNDKIATDKDYVFPLYYSADTGRTWTKFATHPEPGQNAKGKIAVSADGKAVLWNPDQKKALYRTEDWGATWTLSTVPDVMNLRPTADPVNPNVFYVFGGELYKSVDKGKTFAKAGTRNLSWSADMQAAPGKEGHIWVVGGSILSRTYDGGATFTDIDPFVDPVFTKKINNAEAVGFGKAAPGASYPAIYVYGVIDGVKGVFQSIDEAKTWTRMDDAQHQFGSLANGNFVRGDANTFGVVYRSTAGRGIAARMPSDWEPKVAVAPGPRAKAGYQAARFAGGRLALEIEGNGALDVSAFDLHGRRVFGRTFTKAATLELKTLVGSPGMYFLMVRDPRNALLLKAKAILTE